MPHLITLLALDGCFASSIVGAMDLFDTANMVGARQNPTASDPIFQWQVLSPDGHAVRASNGYPLSADGALEDAPPAKLVMIPPFGAPQPKQLLAALKRHGHLASWLKAQYEAGVTLAASCSGTFLLAESGLLDGRRATTSWWLADAFRQRYENVALEAGSMITESDRLMCSGAGMSHLDLSLLVIERYAGRKLAHLCAKYAVLDDRRRSQAPYAVLNHTRTYDPLVAKAEEWIQANLHRNIRAEDIAAHVAVSPRTLARRFKKSTGDTAQVFVQKVRVEACKALLETTDLRLSEILDQVGYMDDSTFRRLFRRYTDLSPRDYRRRFGLNG